MKKHILIIAFKFPPFNGIASKRWTKYSKYLASHNYIVHIVTVRWKDKGMNSWLADINQNIIIHKIPSLGFHYFRDLDLSQRSIFLKLFRSLFFKFIRFIYYLDDAQFWGFFLVPYCNQLIKKNNIKNVIATGQPFMANYWSSKLKKQNSNLCLINDFRDAWNEGPVKKTFIFNKRGIIKQNYVLKYSDYITVVSEGMKRLIVESFQIMPDKIKVLYNGFDENDFTHFNHKSEGKKFEIVYPGNLNFGRLQALNSILKQIKYLIESNLIDKDKIKINLIGRIPKEQIQEIDYFLKYGIISISKPVSPDFIFNLFQSSSLLLLVNSKLFPYAMSSKFFEYLRTGIPMLIVTPPGDISEMCENLELEAICFSEDNELEIRNYILSIYSMWKKDNFSDLLLKEIPKLSNFSYENQIHQIERLFV